MCVVLGRRGVRCDGILLGPRVLALHDHQCQFVDVNAEQVAKAQFDIISGRFVATLHAETAAVAAELVLEGDDGVLWLVLGLDTFAGALPGLVPPPFVDLLLAHIEVLGVSGAKLLDALPGPHGVLPELGAKKEELTLGFAFALTVLVDFV